MPEGLPPFFASSQANSQALTLKPNPSSPL